MYDDSDSAEALVMADPGGASRNDLERIARLADGLVEQLGAARRRLDALRIELEDEPAPVPEVVVPAPALDESDPDLVRDRIRLDAMNMALTGSTREETRAHLLENFSGVEIDDIDNALDVTFGEVLNGGTEGDTPKRFRRKS